MKLPSLSSAIKSIDKFVLESYKYNTLYKKTSSYSNVNWFDDSYLGDSDTKGILYQEGKKLVSGVISDFSPTLSISHGFESSENAAEHLATAGLQLAQQLGKSIVLSGEEGAKRIGKLADELGISEKINNYSSNSNTVSGFINKISNRLIGKDVVSTNGIDKFITDIKSNYKGLRTTLVDSQIINKSSKFKKFTGTSADIQIPTLTIYFIYSEALSNIKTYAKKFFENTGILGKEAPVSNDMKKLLSAISDLATSGQLLQSPPHKFTFKNRTVNEGNYDEEGLLTLVTPTAIYKYLVVNNVNITYSQTAILDEFSGDSYYDGQESPKKVKVDDINLSNYFSPLYIKVDLSFEFAVLPSANEVLKFFDISNKNEYVVPSTLDTAIQQAINDRANKLKSMLDSINDSNNSALNGLIAASNAAAEAKAYATKGLSFLNTAKGMMQRVTGAIQNARKFVENSALMSFVNNVTDAVNQVGQMGNEISNIVNEATGMVSDITSTVQGVATSLNTAVSSISGAIGSGISSINGAIDQVSNIKSSFTGVIDTSGNIIYNTGNNAKRMRNRL